jgi:hypothetical protein
LSSASAGVAVCLPLGAFTGIVSADAHLVRRRASACRCVDEHFGRATACLRPSEVVTPRNVQLNAMTKPDPSMKAGGQRFACTEIVRTP